MPVFGAAPSPEEFNLEDLFQAGAFGDRNNWLEISDSDLMDFGITDVNQRLNLLQGRGVEGVISNLFPDLSNVNPQALLGDSGLNEGFVPGFTQQNIFSDTNPLSHPLANLGGDYYHSNVGYDGSNPLLDALGLTNTGNVFDQSLRFSGNEQNYSYDPFANRDNIGNVFDQSMRSVGNEQNYAYDPFANKNLADNFDQSMRSVGNEQNYSYDPFANRNLADNFDQSLRISGNEQNYTYDPFANRNLADSFDQSGREVGNQQNYNYDPFANRNESNPLDQSLRPSGNQQNYAYDPFASDNIATNLFDQSGREIGNEQNYSYDPFENRQGSNVFDQSLRSIGNQQNYDYDPFANRNDLGNVFDQSLRASGNEQNYSYDPFANRGTSLQPNPFDQSLRASGNEQNYSYDPFADRSSPLVDFDQSLRAAGNELNVNYDPFANRGGEIDVTGGYSPLDHPAWGLDGGTVEPGGAVELPEPAGKFAFSPDFSPNFSPTFAPDFANMFAGFNPLEGLQLTPEGGAGGIGYGGTGGSATVTNLFGDQGIFGGNPLLGQGAVEGGNVDFKQGAFDFGDMISSPLIDKGAFAGMIGPDAFDFSDFIGKDAFDFSNMISSPLVDKGAFDFGNMISSPLIDKDAFDFSNFIGKDAFDFTDMISSPLIDRNAFSGMIGPEAFDFTGMIGKDAFDLSNTFDRGAFDFGNMNTGLLGEGAIQINDSLPDWLTNPFDIYQNIRPHMEENIRDMIPDLFPQGDFQSMLEEIIGTPIAGMQADIEALKSGGLLGELNKLDALTKVSAPSGETAEFAGMASGDHFMEGPRLSMPEIMDYSQALQMPMYDNIIKSLDAANPYDTRRDDILGGQNAYLDEIYDEKRANLENRFAVMDNLGSPGFREAMKDLEEDRARAKMGVTSQFGQEAARTDESTRRGRVSDLASALGFETGRVRDEMGFQDQLQRQATSDFNNYMEQIFRSHMAPQDSYDNALRMMLGGLGTAIQPNIGAAMTGLGGNVGTYQDKMNQNTRNMQMMMNPGAFRNFER